MSCQLHHVRFYKPPVPSIHCIILHPKRHLLALSRNDASIEIWDLQGVPFLSRLIPGTPSGSIEALTWVNDRLLSTGLSGAIIEWDLQNLIPKDTVLVTGHAAWCLDVTKQFTKLAVGTEQGYINIFSVKSNIEYEKIFDKQEGRILCCKFDPSGEILVTGSIENIRIWSVNSGQALYRMTTSRSEKNKETIVWCLEITPDLTIISGDSRGHLTFWDARMGEQIESINTHKADILSICLSEDQKSLYCAGVDPLIINYTKVKMKHKADNVEIDKWVKNIQRNIHQHDVRAMVILNNKLYSGGIDGYLAMSSFPPKVLVKYPFMTNSAVVCPQSKFVCLKYPNAIEIWQLGSASHGKGYVSLPDEVVDDDLNENNIQKQNISICSEKESYDIKDSGHGKRLRLDENLKFLLRLSSKKSQIVCYAIASSRKYIAYSTEYKLKIFKLLLENNSVTLTKLVPLPAECVPCYRLAFSPDSNTLVLGLANGVIKFIRIHLDGGITIEHTIDTKNIFKSCTLTHLYISDTIDDYYYLVASDTESNIGIWKVNYNEDSSLLNFITHLPQYKYPPSAITIDTKEKNILIAYTDQKLIEYSLKKLRFTKWSKAISDNDVLGTKWWNKMFPITGINVHPIHSHILMAYDDCGIYVINKNLQTPKLPENKKIKLNNSQHLKVFYSTKKYKHLVAAQWIHNDMGETEVALVIVEPTSLLEGLPPAFFKKYFGCM